MSLDFHITSHDLQITIRLICIRGISIRSHEDPGGDVEALLLSGRASKDASKDASRVLPDREKLYQTADTRSSRPSLAGHGCLRQRARGISSASNEIESEADAF